MVARVDLPARKTPEPVPVRGEPEGALFLIALLALSAAVLLLLTMVGVPS